MKPQVVTLVRNSSVVYPLTDKDSETLENLGVPIIKIDLSYLPTLRVYASAYSFELVDLSDLELKMLKNFKAKWPHEATIDNKAIVLVFPRKTSEDLVDTAVASLKKWYRNHFIKLEQVTRRGGKTIKVVLTKKGVG